MWLKQKKVRIIYDITVSLLIKINPHRVIRAIEALKGCINNQLTVHYPSL